jgi:ferredoxin
MEPRGSLPPAADESRCTACGQCVRACPRGLIELVPVRTRFTVACLSHDKGPAVRKVCDVGCIACGLCVKQCPEQAIAVTDSLAAVRYEACRNSGECQKACPTKCIQRMP